MNSRLERLKKTIEKCEKVEEIFTRQGVSGEEIEISEDGKGTTVIAGFDGKRSDRFFFGWHLVSHGLENDYGKKPAYFEVELFDGTQDNECRISVFYFPTENEWMVEGANGIGLDGPAIIRSLAADCRLSAGEKRQIGEDEAMKIIATLCAFFMSQPVTA
jgi:hypothetical protein